MGNTVLDIIRKPSLLFLTFGHKGLFNWMNDERYLKIAYKIRMGRSLNIENPKTYSEKLQWLKLYDRNPIYTDLVDKYKVKSIVSDIIGEEYIIPTIGVWNSADDIDFNTLPNKFVLKCTHDSGGIIICKDKTKLDITDAKRRINSCLNHNFYYGQREWPYKNIKPKVIAEEYMEDLETHELRDYKFFVFNGVVKSLYIVTERGSSSETKFDFFDEEFNHLPFKNGYPNAKLLPKKPRQFELMKELATKLSKGIPHLRVDFYEVNGKVFFGEITFFHMSGMAPFEPEEWDYKFGSWLELPKK
ncbi:glycosyl transferase [Enterococcus faecium]|nr:glycosyl transferase [Enterococcus faecium]